MTHVEHIFKAVNETELFVPVYGSHGLFRQDHGRVTSFPALQEQLSRCEGIDVAVTPSSEPNEPDWGPEIRSTS